MTYNPFASVSRSSRDDVLNSISGLERELTVLHSQAEVAVNNAERHRAPDVAKWLRRDVRDALEQALDTLRSLMDDANEIGQPDEYDTLRQHCADRRWHEGRVL